MFFDKLTCISSKSNITFMLLKFYKLLLSLTFCFVTFGNDRTESAQFEYISQFLFGFLKFIVISAAVCCVPPPFTATFSIELLVVESVLKIFEEMICDNKIQKLCCVCAHKKVFL